MRRFVVTGTLVGSSCGCKSDAPAGTVLADWTYEASEAEAHPVPIAKRPPQTITSNVEWPLSKGPPVKLRFETEIGDLASDVHWNWPRHIRITLAEPTGAKLPNVDCMPGPPGNKVENGKLVRPVGHDGTPSGLVGCFFSSQQAAYDVVFEVNGDGDVTRSTPKH
jgi:hypothetical protein